MLSSLTALGKKRFLSLSVLAGVALQRLSQGSRLKKWELGCVLSFIMFTALLKHGALEMVDRDGRGQPMMFCKA